MAATDDTIETNEVIHVEAARIPDRDRLLEELRDAGIEARPVDELEVEVPLGQDAEVDAADVFEHVENVIMSIGGPFVPVTHEDVIYIRPPLS